MLGRSAGLGFAPFRSVGARNHCMQFRFGCHANPRGVEGPAGDELCLRGHADEMRALAADYRPGHMRAVPVRSQGASGHWARRTVVPVVVVSIRPFPRFPRYLR